MGQIHGAAETLQTLNKRYSALLKHSSRSVALMVSLFSSFRGQIQEAAGPRLKQADLVLPGVNAMGGLNTSLFIGVQALEATQGALDATSNNIANANTPGYTREVAQLSEGPETQTGDFVPGGGVIADQSQSVRDELLNLQIQQQTSDAEQRRHPILEPSADSELLHNHRRRHRQHADRVFKQPRAVVRQLSSTAVAAERSFQRPESGRILQHHGQWPHQRAIGRRPTGDANRSADQLAYPADRAVERAARGS